MTWILLTAAVVIATPLGFVALRRRAAARKLALPSSGIDEHGFVRIGGVDQWVQVRGADRANPVLLWLHPHGASMIPLTPLYTALERHFTVVQWDRRSVGRTRRAARGRGDADWTFDRFVADGIELVEHLRQRLGQDRVVLAAHSQGTVIGVGMARRRPDLFHAYVGMGQMVDMARNESLAYERLLARTRAEGRHRVVARLVKLGPPPYADRTAWMRRLQYAMTVDPEGRAWRTVAITRVLLMPGYSPRDILGWFGDVMAFPQHLYEETMAVTPQTLGTDFEVPVLLLHGADETWALPELAQEYAEAIRAPAKAYVPLAGLGHLAPFLAPDRILDELRARIPAR
ncbi:alpha/beta fold hydrolase [Dactylosporangium sucinum]|uniref:Proline iminopeptidase n=1 Tax=Dactylosporangium sucinum TaxID=1424081 RepID=A0A917WZJ6_9ACTN|nr:alpha/beta hydrolase [Dactylosporangium sucinum]GGM44469.1 proline iminopeptidase [Dactylosporangium sucinum]